MKTEELTRFAHIVWGQLLLLQQCAEREKAEDIALAREFSIREMAKVVKKRADRGRS